MSEKYDVLIIGGGISGIQSAIDLGDQGYSVLMVEKRVSIGGVMIQLSKVFPTLDCGSCITTPKMSEAFKHENVDVRTLSEVTHVERKGRGFSITVHERTRYVDMNACTACGNCEDVCPITVYDDWYNEGMGPMKAIGVPFDTALPQKAVLNPDYCIFCGRCARVCAPECIDFELQDRDFNADVGAIIIATGFIQTPIIKEEYGGGRFRNVITGLKTERLLAPTGPFGGVFRPSDSKTPWNIAIVQCAGSRDATIGVPYCSAICCIYAVKQSILLCAAAPLSDITVYYMDIRTFGKGHEEFFEEAKAMGINFVKGKVAKITELDNKDLRMRVETFGEYGGVQDIEHDMVILSLGLVPAWDPTKLLPEVSLNEYGFVRPTIPKLEPSISSAPGMFVAGVAAGPKDIVESIVSGSSAAMKASQWLEGNDVSDSTAGHVDLPVVSAPTDMEAK